MKIVNIKGVLEVLHFFIIDKKQQQRIKYLPNAVNTIFDTFYTMTKLA